jgi:hypothetical protein
MAYQNANDYWPNKPERRACILEAAKTRSFIIF